MDHGPRLAWLGVAASLAAVLAARSVRSDTTPASPPARMTVEIDWKSPELPALPEDAAPPTPPTIDLEVPGGRILGAIAWPLGSTGGDELTTGENTCRLGVARRGTVRARVEAPPGGSLIIRAGGQATAFSVGRLAETAQETGPTAPVKVRMTRLAWDVLEIDLVPGPEGRPTNGEVAPGAMVPVRVGFNILTAEPTEGIARLIAKLRPARAGADVLWHYDQSHFVASNPVPGATPAVLLNVPAPRDEGGYVLSIETIWEPASVGERSRIGRLIGRRRGNAPAAVSARRETSFVVLDPDRHAPGAAASPGIGPSVVESIDLARVRGPRPSASGRASAPTVGRPAWAVPDAALVEVAFRDRLRGWMPWGADAALMSPANHDGLAWVALGLHVVHPGRPHRLTLSIASGEPQALGVGLIVTGDGHGRKPRVLLDACVSAPPSGESHEPTTVSWPIWPDATDPVLVLVNRGSHAVRLGAVTLEELPEDLPPAPLIGPTAETDRRIGVVLTDPGDLDRFGPRGDPVAVARNLSSYLAQVGATTAVLPDAMAADRSCRRALDGQADEDATGPDRLNVLLRLLAERKLEAMLDLRLDGPLPGLPAPDSAEAVRQGLVSVDARGRADGPSYSPLHPAVRSAVLTRAGEAIAPRRDHPNLTGLLVRLGPGPTLAGSPATGLDDETFDRFVTAMLDPKAARSVPGRDPKDPNRFTARQQYLAGPGRTPWLAWRSREVGTLYVELSKAIRAAAPGAVVAVATPRLDDGPAGREARRADDSGDSPLSAWKAVGLDLDQWPRPAEGLVVLRATGPGLDPLAQDLSAHPDLDAPVARRPTRGALLEGEAARGDHETLILTAAPPGAADELLGHALAALDAQWVLLDASAVAGREAAVARFARIVRALPAQPEPDARPLAPEKGVAARVWSRDGKTLLGMANDTPYPMTVEAVLRGPAEAPVDDLGRALRLEPRVTPSGRSVVLELPPFGASALRIGGEVQVDPMTLFQSELAEAQNRVLSARLARMAQGLPAALPPNPGFEEAEPRGAVVAEIGGSAVPPRGWTVSEAGTATIDGSQRHSGSASLRFEARSAPASLTGEPFTPPPGPELEVRAWLRADRPGTPVRVWIEGTAAGKPVSRRGELTLGPEWAEKRLKVTGLPEAGLDQLSLRFELTAPGRLWLDDLAVQGPHRSEPDSRSQLVLVKAQQAFRAGRIADFARLANSHWARAAALAEPAAPPVRTGRSSETPTRRR